MPGFVAIYENGSFIEKGFIVAGQSAGGNLAGSVSLRAAEDSLFETRKLTGQILQFPATIDPRAAPEKCAVLCCAYL